MIRRALAATAVAALGLLVLAPNSHAGTDKITEGRFKGSHLTTAATSSVSNPALTAVIERPPGLAGLPLPQLNVSATLPTPAGLPSGCGATVGAGSPQKSREAEVSLTFGTDISCNGVYTYGIHAEDSSAAMDLEGTIVVEVAPSAVNGVSATASQSARTVSVSWTASSGTAPDFKGYQVQRRHGSGSWTKVADVGESATAAVDDNVPIDGGDYTYRVLGRRAGVGGDVLSAEGSTDKVTLPEGEATTTTAATDGTGSTVAGGGTGSSVPGDTTSSSTRTRVTIGARGRTGVGIKAPRLGTPSQANLPVLLTPTTVDEGFDQSLPFEDQSIEDGPTLPDEASSSAFYENGPGKGMAVPVATGLVLFAWAIHLRFLARASRPEGGEHFGDPFDPFLDPMT